MLKNTLIQAVFTALLLLPFTSFCQNLLIDYENPEFIEVCESGEFIIQLTAGNTEINNIEVEVWFPNGVTYTPGSVNGATELDITNLNRPKFSVMDLSQMQNHEFDIKAEASCQIISDINQGKLFANTITVNFNDTDDRIITQPYRVETGLLVITDITPETATGQFSDFINRRITVRNTRFSKIKEIELTDLHQGGILISTNGTNPSFDSTTYNATFDASHFRTIGNGDDFFDFNEELIIVEQITIDNCGEDFEQSNSFITLNWGCNGDICQSTTRTATINIEDYTKVAVIEFEPRVFASSDYCDGQNYTEFLTVKNTGNDVATNLNVQILGALMGSASGKDSSSISVTSAGMSVPHTIRSNAFITNPDCDTTLFASFTVEFEELLPNQSVEISWENEFCDVACDAGTPPLVWNYYFERVCPIDSLQRGIPEVFNSDSRKLLKDSISYFIGEFIRSGNRYEFRYDLISEILDDSTGTIQIEFNLPCGYDWPTSPPFILDGKSPSNVDINEVGENTFVTLDFELPFTSDHVWTDFFLEFTCTPGCIPVPDADLVALVSTCPEGFFLECWDGQVRASLVELDGQVPLGVIDTNQIQVMTKFIGNNPDLECSLSDCEEFNLRYLCRSGEGDLDSHPFEAYIDFDGEFRRENIGLKDSDDNRIADDGSIAPLNEVRADRFLPGDTSITKISGEVVNDLLPVDSKNLNFRICFEGHIVDFGNEGEPIRVYDVNGFPRDAPLFTVEDGIKNVDAVLKIIDKDTGQEYECPMNNFNTVENQLISVDVVNTRPPVPFDDWRLLSYTYSLNLPSASSIPGSSIPPGFSLSEGDSVYFEARHRLIYNADLRVLNIRHYSEVVLFSETGDIEENFSCGRPRNDFQIVGYQLRRNVGNFNALPCDEFDQPVGSNFNLSLGKPNIFPFEVRPLMQVPQWDLLLGFGYELLESRIVNMGMNNYPATVTNQSITPTLQSGVYKFDIFQYQTPAYDEGFYFNIYHRFAPLPVACSFEEGSTLQLIGSYDYLHDFPAFPDMEQDTIGSTTGFTPIIADLDMIAVNPNYVSNDNTANWDIKLENKIIYEGRNVWMHIDSRSNRIFDFVVTNTDNGQEITPDNGIYQLGTFDGYQLSNYNIASTIDFCGVDSIDIYFGWNCEPLKSFNAFACNRDTYQVQVFAPLPELEMAITSPLDSVELCDTIPFHTIEVFNADLGSAFDLNLKVLMPTGMTILPGSSEVAYSTATGNYVTIPDPQDLGNSNYSWSINDIITDINNDGLPGVVNSPENSFSIRFLSFANCGLIASAPAIANITGFNSCDEHTNSLSKPGEEINVRGVVPDYETNITPDREAIVSCGDELDLTIRIQASGITQVGDSILLTLPPGINYVDNSYTNIENAVSDPPIIQVRGDFTSLSWPMIEGLPAITNIRFSLKTTGYGNAVCQDEIIQVQTIQSKEAFCKTSNDFCPVFVQSGIGFIQIQVEFPQWQFTNFTSSLGATGIDYVLNGTNTGDDSQSPLEISFYLDSDGNGFFSPGDMLITNRVLMPNDFVNGMFSISGQLNVSEADICNVIAVISPENNCTCFTEQLMLSGQQVVQMSETVCSEEIIQVGVSPVSGANYFWDTPINLSCSDCPMADFSFLNTTNDVQTFNYILTEDSGNCPTLHLISVDVFPLPQVRTPDTQICEGQSITLTTTPAQSVVWNGPGLSNSNVSNPVVTPSQTATYIVEISNTNCSNTDSVTIDVIPGPIVNAGPDTSLCNFTGNYQLEAFFDPNYSYFWEPNFLLSDFLIHNPSLTNNLSTEFVLVVTDNNTSCSATDTVFVDFGETPELSISNDVTICGGQSTELLVNGADDYEWTTATTLICNDSCQSITVSPDQTTTYYVTGTTAGMCDSRDSITVNVEGEIKFTSESFSICQGDSLEIFGDFYFQSDTVSMVFQSFVDGCDSTHTVNLNVTPTLTTEVFNLCAGDTVDLFNDGEMINSAGEICRDFKTNQGCDSTHCFNVSIVPLPNITSVFDTLTIEIGDSVELALPDGFASYNWSPDTGLSCTDCRVTTASPAVTTDYIGSVINDNGCSVQFRYHIRVVQQCSADNVTIPNIFSPNGDSRNEMFCSIGVGAEEIISMRIFNRWGQKIYDASGTDAKWDGTYKNENQPVGVYVYIIELGCDGTLEEEFVGDVTLLR